MTNSVLKKSNIVVVILMIVLAIFFVMPITTHAEEINNDIVLEDNNIELTEVATFNEEVESVMEEETVVEAEAVNEEETEEVTEDNQRGIMQTNEEHKVTVVTTKVDEEGNPLSGAVLQIIDSNGNVVDEWTTDGSAHETLLTEGTYTLHEKSAPEGYIKADDKSFTVKVEIVNLDSGVDFSETPCQHYGGTPLYYVEIDGEKQEVYCINQDWETPDDNSTYDGAVLTPTEIRDFTEQTVYTDAHQNTGKVDVSDQSLTAEELYNKILDIIYHRQLATDLFSDLTEAEIRYVTESALKNYTNAGLTRVQRVLRSQAPQGYDKYDYYITGNYVWYLYPWYRSFVYDPNAPLGQDIFKTDIGNGDAFGNLARHWSSGHNAKNSQAVREKIARYYELYLYLIGDTDHHPSDMHLYIFSTNDKSLDWSQYDFDEGAYQNLLGVRWYTPNDEKHIMNLTLVNKKEEPKEEKKISSMGPNPQTGDNVFTYLFELLISIFGLCFSVKYLKRI